ncbi:biotin transporter BioY [Archaeoglobales archaeon]|nr:MAG: biotin transporter BioY [Archaeoglobales archaeon ex4484_92]RLI81123.1 MAG: biotin transporter BioY [Archaeoglobales archaeon]
MVDNKKITLAVSMAIVTAIFAQLKFKIGPVPYTMQNLSVMLAGFILGPKYGAVSMLIYLSLIAIGLPVSSVGGGIAVLIGPTSGYLIGFVLSAYLAGIFRKLIWRKGSRVELTLLWLSTLISVIPTYLLGFIVFYEFAIGSSELANWVVDIASFFGFTSDSIPLLILFTSVLIFLPQDLFVDHLLAVLVFNYVSRMLKERGVRLD